MLDREAFSIEALAERGPLGRTSLYQAIASGELIARKFGRRTFVLADDWHNFLESRPTVAAAKSDAA